MTAAALRDFDRPAAPSMAGPLQALLALLLIVVPLFIPDFWRLQVGAYALILGTIGLSLMFLAGYGGMVSLVQMTVAGVAGYGIAIIGTNSVGLGLGWPWWITIPLSLLAATGFGALSGWLSVRTAGIYTIMITLAIGTAFYYFAVQNYELFNGHKGFAGLAPPELFGLDWRAPLRFYYLCLAVAALCYAAVLYVSRSTFGIALQAIRDNPRRMEAIGFDVKVHRIAAYAFAALIAALGGILLVWFNGRISPGNVSVDRIVDILVITVIGGLAHPIGAFLGAIIFVLLDNFAIDLVGADRPNTVIGAVFLAIVLFSPDGILGLWRKIAPASRARREDWDARTTVSKGAAGREANREPTPAHMGGGKWRQG